MKSIVNHSLFSRLLPLFLFSLALSWLACESPPEIGAHLTPFADFEEQESTMLCWNKKHKNTLLHVISLIAREEHVTLFYNENYHRGRNIEVELLNRQINLDNVTLAPFKLEKDNVWIRDYGPTFLTDPDGNTAILDFEYPHLEFKDYTNFTDQFSARMKLPLLRSRIHSVGGGREINGKGTIILVEDYELFINPGLTIPEIEQEYRERFNQKKVIWLKRGIPQDDFFGHGPLLDNVYGYGVGGHVDEFCRFIDANTLLLTKIDSADLQRDTFYHLINERLVENERILSQATDQDGQPFRIIRVPQAPVIFAQAQLDTADIFYTPVTSYLNFIITNKSVIIPAYYQEGAPDYVREKDEQARKVFQEAFPTRKVHTVMASELNHDGGGLHCVTLPKPGNGTKANPLRNKKRLG